MYKARSNLGWGPGKLRDIASNMTGVDVVVAPRAGLREHEALAKRTDGGGCRDSNKRNRDDPGPDRLTYGSLEQVVERPLDAIQALSGVGKCDDDVVLVSEDGVDVRAAGCYPVDQAAKVLTPFVREGGS